MAFSLDKILNSEYLPHWIEQCEIQQGTYDIDQDITLDEPNQTYTSEVFGTSNRPLFALYAISKIIAKISRNHHYENGSHHIIDSDVSNNALIKESPDVNNDSNNDPLLTTLRKLKLDFYGMEMPDELIPKNYSTTVELADKINSLYQYIDMLRKGLGSHIAFRNTIQEFIEEELGATGFKEEPITLLEESSRSEFIIKEAELFLNGRSILIKKTNSFSNNKNIIELSHPSKVSSVSPQAEVVFLELYFTHLTDAHVPLGNRHYENDVAIIPASTSAWLPFISDKTNNIFIDPNFHLTQLQYKISNAVFDPSISSYGVDQVVIDDQAIIKSNIRGVWKADDNSFLIFPIMAVANRNLGIYHFSINPMGTAVARAGITISSTEDCFDQSKIAYYSSAGAVCTNYSVYSDDSYTHDSIEYFRSGLQVSLHTSNPLGYYADKVYLDDVVTIGKQMCLDHSSIVNDLCEKILGNELYTELNPVMKGSASAMVPGYSYARNPLQIIGFGVSEEALFGFDNKGGIFIDESNNGIEGTIDGVRTYWGDPAYTVPMSFSFTEGNGNSESRSYLTYEPTSQTLTLNTTALSGVPSISSIPVLVWDDGTAVALTTAWVGIGTTSSTCVIIPRTGRKVYGLVNFLYRLGSGVPYILDGTVLVKDLAGNSYNFCIQKSENYCLGNCTWVGNPVSGDESGLVLPECIDCDSPTDIIGSYCLVLSGSNPGEYRQIASYDCDSRIVLFAVDFINPIVNTDKVSIGRLEPGHTTVVINPFGRGVVGAFKRSRVLVSGTKYFSDLPIIDSSDGTLVGTTLKDLVNATYIEVTTREDEPLTSGFYIYARCNPIFNQYKAIPNCEMEIIKPGVLIDTTKGSANSPFSLYRQFVAPYSISPIGETKWISTDCITPYFKIKPIEYWDINYDIRPTENLILDSINGIITTRKYKLGDIQSVISDIEITLPNNRVCASISLVEINNWYYLLCNAVYEGKSGLQTGYLLDINKIY